MISIKYYLQHQEGDGPFSIHQRREDHGKYERYMHGMLAQRTTTTDVGSFGCQQQEDQSNLLFD